MVRLSVAVLIGFCALACGGDAPPSSAADAASEASALPSAAADHGHAHEAPRGGTLVEVGDHFAFIELVLDSEAGSLTVYVLDAEAEQAVRIAQPTISVTFDAPERLTGQVFALEAKANVLTGETVGDTSQFGVTDAALKGVAVTGARIREVTVKGQTFRDLVVTSST